jgi:hypothetical protein
VTHACHPRYGGKHKIIEFHSPGWPGNKGKPYLQNNQSKRLEDVAQVVERLRS